MEVNEAQAGIAILVFLFVIVMIDAWWNREELAEHELPTVAQE